MILLQDRTMMRNLVVYCDQSARRQRFFVARFANGWNQAPRRRALPTITVQVRGRARLDQRPALTPRTHDIKYVGMPQNGMQVILSFRE